MQIRINYIINTISQKVVPEGRSASALTSPNAASTTCSFVSLSCADTGCGQRIQRPRSPLTGPGPFPWTVALLADGVYICGASIIHHQFVMTSVTCAQKLLRYR